MSESNRNTKRLPYSELKKRILSHDIPKEMQLNQCSHIFNCEKFLDANFTIIEANPGKKFALPYYLHLVEFLENLEQK